MQAFDTPDAAVGEAVRAWFARASVHQFACAEFAQDPTLAEVVFACHADGTLELRLIGNDGSMVGGTL